MLSIIIKLTYALTFFISLALALKLSNVLFFVNGGLTNSKKAGDSLDELEKLNLTLPNGESIEYEVFDHKTKNVADFIEVFDHKTAELSINGGSKCKQKN